MLINVDEITRRNLCVYNILKHEYLNHRVFPVVYQFSLEYSMIDVYKAFPFYQDIYGLDRTVGSRWNYTQQYVGMPGKAKVIADGDTNDMNAFLLKVMDFPILMYETLRKDDYELLFDRQIPDGYGNKVLVIVSTRQRISGYRRKKIESALADRSEYVRIMLNKEL